VVHRWPKTNIHLYTSARDDCAVSQWLNSAGTGRNGVPSPVSGVPQPEIAVPPPQVVVPPPSGDDVMFHHQLGDITKIVVTGGQILRLKCTKY